MGLLSKIALLLCIVGGINWGLIGLFGFNLVSFLLGDMTIWSRCVYTLVGLGALWSVTYLFMDDTKKLPDEIE